MCIVSLIILPEFQVNKPKNPEFEKPTVPVVPAATVRASEFGKADDTGVLDLTTAILDVVPRAAQAFSAADVPRV